MLVRRRSAPARPVTGSAATSAAAGAAQLPLAVSTASGKVTFNLLSRHSRAPSRARSVDVAIHGIDLDPAELLAAQFQVVHDDIERRNVGRLFIEQRLDLAGRCRGETETRQPRVHAPAPQAARATRLAELDIAIEFGGVDVGAPVQAFTRTTDHHVVQFSPLHVEFFRADGHHGGQVTQRSGRRAAAGGVCRDWRGPRRLRAGGGVQNFLPRVQIHLGQIDVGRHSGVRQLRYFAGFQPDTDAAANDARLGAADVTHIADGGDVADRERQPVLQRLPRFQ